VKTRHLTLCAFLLTLVCSQGLAEPQALITVDPNTFAPGQNLSNATTGAQLLAATEVLTPDNGFLIQYSPSVYAQPVAPGCTWAGIPCAASGNLVFGSSPTTIPSTQVILWGDARTMTPCVSEPPPQFSCGFTGIFPVLRVNFSVPTDKATAIIGFGLEDNSEIAGFAAAFDESGQLVATCVGGFNTPFPPCLTVLSTGGRGGWAQFTISRPTADINFILVGGEANDRPISQVQFDSPVSLQLAGLLTKVKGVGPGKSLANQIMFAQTYYAVPDIHATCSTLTGFLSEVKAQSGKKVSTPTADQLLATAQSIETAIQCN